MGKEWLKEQARDLIAIGSIPLLVLTVARVSVMTAYYPAQFIISSSLFFVLKMVFKAELRAGIGFILLVFISIFYHNALFTAFALIVYAGMIIALFYLGRDRMLILKGILLGMISSAAGYIIVRRIFF